MFSRLRGQFAFALLDIPRQRLILGRDRVGICPLHWSRHGDWLVFASEIKALIASGLVPVAPDPERTRQHVHVLLHARTPHCLCRNQRRPSRPLSSRSTSAMRRALRSCRSTRTGISTSQTRDPRRSRQRPDRLISAFDETFGQAVRRRLRADVPVAAYLSGGVDSSLVVAKCQEIANSRLSTFTARISDRGLDESRLALGTAEQFGCDHHTVECDPQTLVDIYPRVVAAAECPVVDLNASSLYALSRAVHRAGFKVVLSGEGADEALAGYIWFKAHRLIHAVGWRGFKPLVSGIERLYHHEFPKAPRGEFRRIYAVLGGLHAQTLGLPSDEHAALVALTRRVRAEDRTATRPTTSSRLTPSRVGRWHPLNQSLYMGYKTQLPGLLFNHRGDRAAMANSVETRYPFLDESVIDFACRIHPRWKLRGLHRDKHLLRLTAQRALPKPLAMRRKAMFRAPFANTLMGDGIPYVRQFLSPESIERTPYFSARGVDDVFSRFRRGAYLRPFRLFYEMSLCTVVATQLWHHMFLGGGLCELPRVETACSG